MSPKGVRKDISCKFRTLKHLEIELLFKWGGFRTTLNINFCGVAYSVRYFREGSYSTQRA